MHLIRIALIGLISVFSISCSNNPDDNTINIFSIEDDKMLGAQVDTEVRSQPQNYPILQRSDFPEAYNYMDSMVAKILATDQVFYKDEFDWKVTILHDDDQLNAFATPGGYIYVYTGLIKYLEAEDQLAGVMGHEMAHADRRHSTDQLTRVYGITVLLEVVVGKNQNVLTEIAANLLSLKFSRNNESEADEYSVIYLCPTDWEADGAADFFQKIEDEGPGHPPEFLSTHPSPENRVQAIKEKKTALECSGTATYDAAYARV